MNPASLSVRRASVDDLPALRALWVAANLPVNGLEARLTEFQVVESGGVLAGAGGGEIIRQHLRLHSEDYTDFALADAARELFWERIQVLTSNHGVFRVWTQETSPFWTRMGFAPAKDKELERLPEEWKRLEGGWRTLELKNEEAINQALNTHLPALLEESQSKAARTAAHARRFKIFLTVIFFLIAAVGFSMVIYLLRHRNPFVH